MTKLPYGGFILDPESEHDDPWTRLDTINEHLEDGEVIPPDLAEWLGRAITSSKKDPNAFLRLLGLKKPRGRTAKHLSKEWIKYAERLYELECQGVKPEAALKKIMEEDPDNLDRSQLQRWLNNYKKALAETARP